MSPLLNPLTFVPILFGISCIEWWVFGRKGMALLERRPSLIGWVCLEVILGVVAGLGLFSTFKAQSWIDLTLVTAALTAGAALGCALSGAIKWRRDEQKS